MTNNQTPYYTIREKSVWARLAAFKLGAHRVGLVLGSTIHLHNVSKADFLANKAWLQHELCHVRQFKQHGYVNFLLKYLWESCKNGYYNNKYELEARAAEKLHGL